MNGGAASLIHNDMNGPPDLSQTRRVECKEKAKQYDSKLKIEAERGSFFLNPRSMPTATAEAAC